MSITPASCTHPASPFAGQRRNDYRIVSGTWEFVEDNGRAYAETSDANALIVFSMTTADLVGTNPYHYKFRWQAVGDKTARPLIRAGCDRFGDGGIEAYQVELDGTRQISWVSIDGNCVDGSLLAATDPCATSRYNIICGDEDGLYFATMGRGYDSTNTADVAGINYHGAQFYTNWDGILFDGVDLADNHYVALGTTADHSGTMRINLIEWSVYRSDYDCQLHYFPTSFPPSYAAYFCRACQFGTQYFDWQVYFTGFVGEECDCSLLNNVVVDCVPRYIYPCYSEYVQWAGSENVNLGGEYCDYDQPLNVLITHGWDGDYDHTITVDVSGPVSTQFVWTFPNTEPTDCLSTFATLTDSLTYEYDFQCGESTITCHLSAVAITPPCAAPFRIAEKTQTLKATKRQVSHREAGGGVEKRRCLPCEQRAKRFE